MFLITRLYISAYKRKFIIYNYIASEVRGGEAAKGA